MHSFVTSRASVSRVCAASARPRSRKQGFSTKPALQVMVRAQESPSSSAAEPVTTGASLAAVEPVESTLLGAIQEAINGRSAMLGFVAAVISESITHQSVWSQIAGKYVDTELVEKPLGPATLYYFAIVVLVTAASIMPRLIDDLSPASRSFGPFTPALEKTLGRAAMLGFFGWVMLENVLNFHFL